MTDAATRVLDKGFVRLVESMGGDAGVVDAARVSYGGKSKGEEADRKLIAYLLKHQHMTPFEHSVFKFHVSCPIFVMRQWIRHRIASYNEISARYTEVKDEFYVPSLWRSQDVKNKQGSVAAPSLDHAALTAALQRQVNSAMASYKELLAAGVAREMARFVLPVNLYTQFYWTINARSLMNFLSLRADAHAQWEIQQYAEALAGYFKEGMPWTYDAFLRFVWKGENARFAAERSALPER
ncbi:MAG: FAD-dependent thymidylate synthase [Elusimicrobia bacterium]|nr:FAD-dependent thymidylate synthase [Elusimicrobiota bacterium]MDE2426543.1 FAD-dependent thymidylate synthase [Elusimicrobiota bacterium]